MELGSSKAIVLSIWEGLRAYADTAGPSICQDPEREVVIWGEREKVAVMEQDLENNYYLLREVLLAYLKHGESVPQSHFQAMLWWTYGLEYEPKESDTPPKKGF